MSRNLLNQKGNVIYVNSVTQGVGIDVETTGGTSQSSVNISMKNDTTEQTSPNNNDWLLIADNATGKIIKRIQYSNFVDGSSNWILNSNNVLSPILPTTKVAIGGNTIATGFEMQNNGDFNNTGNITTQSLTVSGISGDVNRIAIKDKDLSNTIHIHVPDLISDMNLTLPSTEGTLALQSQIIPSNWTLSSGYLYPNSASTKVIIGRTGTTIYELDVEGSVNINGDLQLDNNRQIRGVREILFNDAGNNNIIKLLSNVDIGSNIDIYLPSIGGKLALEYTGSSPISVNNTTHTIGLNTITVSNGGTGQTTYSNGQLLIGNSSGTLSKSTLTPGDGITLSNGNGSITIGTPWSTDTTNRFIYPSDVNYGLLIGKTAANDVLNALEVFGFSEFGFIKSEQITITNRFPLKFLESSLNGTNGVSLVPPASIPSDYSINLPTSAGTLALQSDLTTQSNFGTSAQGSTFGNTGTTTTLQGQGLTINGDSITLQYNGSTRARLLSNRFETQTTLRTTDSVHFTNLNSNATNSKAVEFHHGSNPSLSTFSWRNQIGSVGDLHFDFRYINPTTGANSGWNGRGFVAFNTSSYVQMNFTGQHKCIPQIEELYDNVENYVGMVVEATGEYNSIDYTEQTVFSNTNASIDEAQPIIRLTTASKSKKVYGVISQREVSQDGKRVFSVGIFSSIVSDLTDNRLVINSIGEGSVLVCNQNGDIENGDLLCSSDIEGIAMKQDTDFIMNYTIGKATQDYNFNGNENKLIGCVYYCG